MITYWIAAKRPVGSKTWTLHPEEIISRTYVGARAKLCSRLDEYDEDWMIARVVVPESHDEQRMVANGCGECGGDSSRRCDEQGQAASE